MRHIFLLISLIFSVSFVSAQKVSFEKTSFNDVLLKAKTEKKVVFIRISDSSAGNEVYDNDNVGRLYNSSFVNYQLTPSDNDYQFIINQYKIKTIPANIFIQPEGGALVHVCLSDNLSANDLISNAELAIAYSKDSKPVAQWDLEYNDKKQDKKFVFNYIEKRSTLGLDNADIIDHYATIAKSELLKPAVVSLFLNKNKYINANGTYFRHALENRKEIQSILKIDDNKFNEILVRSVDNKFAMACDAKCEVLLKQAIDAKLALINPNTEEDSTVIQNEYRTKFYYSTKQPLLLANFVMEYANTILELEQQNLSQKTMAETKGVNPKALFPATFSMNEVKNVSRLSDDEYLDIAYSYKLRDAAQYVVEMLSNKRMLDNALVWSQKAIDLFDNFSNYETHAYILYKLGKRSEAIASMEKAYEVAPESESSVRAKVEAKLIKMKRGERIF